jgi:glycosyltransferase involved in cell wall biosynthesis
LKQLAHPAPFLVSIIVPARNEEIYIKRCLLSLLAQSYPSFEVIMVDDGSTDKTVRIAEAINDKRLKLIRLKKPPHGWSGKSWASHIGYLASKGQTLLYTDADSFYYDRFAIARVKIFMQKYRFDVVTGSPLIELKDFYSKLTMPLFNLFSVFRTVPSDKGKSEYLIGGFFMVNRYVLDEIGGFSYVRSSAQEDTDLGKQIRSSGFSIGLVRVNNLVAATWSRNQRTLLEGIKRIISYNLTTNNKTNSIVDICTILCIVIAPFIMLPFNLQLYEDSGRSNFLGLAIILWNLSLCLSPILGVALKGITKYRLNPLYSLLILFSAGFLLTVYVVNLVNIISFPVSGRIIWKGREYS